MLGLLLLLNLGLKQIIYSILTIKQNIFVWKYNNLYHLYFHFFFVIATILCVLNGIKILILLFGCCWQNRFNNKISNGQIPQYNIVTPEKNNNSNKYNNIKIDKIKNEIKEEKNNEMNNKIKIIKDKDIKENEN